MANAKSFAREQLREQHAIGEEISEAIGQPMGNQALDEDELDEELAELQQEELDNKMLETGNVPVTDKVSRLPSVAQGERKSLPIIPSAALPLPLPRYQASTSNLHFVRLELWG